MDRTPEKAQTTLLLVTNGSTDMAKFAANLDLRFTNAVVITDTAILLEQCRNKSIGAVVIDGNLPAGEQARVLSRIRLNSRLSKIAIIRLAASGRILDNSSDSLFDATVLVGESAFNLRRQVYMSILRRQLHNGTSQRSIAAKTPESINSHICAAA